MRIALCSDTFLPIVDGVGRVVYAYAKELSSRGHQCSVITPMQKSGFRGGYDFEIMDYLSIATPTAAQYTAGVATLDPHYLERVADIPFDIIHAHSPATAGIEALRLARKRKVPLVGTFHSKYYDDIMRYTHSDVISSVGVKLISSFYERCDEVWTVSGNAAETLRDYGYKGEIRIVRNGCDIKKANTAWEEKARKEFRLDKRPIFLFVGQMDIKKNIMRIAEAANIIHMQGYEFQLVFAGRGKDEEKLKSYVNEAGMKDCVSFTGHIFDPELLSGLYMAASLFVFPSMYDTAGLVVSEAAMMGTPSLVVKGSAPAEMITNGENGLICEDNPVQISEAMRQFIYASSEETKKEISSKAQRTLPLSWRSVINEAERHYIRIIDAYFAADDE